MSGYLDFVECVVHRKDAKDVFKAFCDDPDALNVQIMPKDRNHDAITCNFENEDLMTEILREVKEKFPGVMYNYL